MPSDGFADETAQVTVPNPDGGGELHTLKAQAGDAIEGDVDDPTTNRAYFSHAGDGLEMTAEQARRLAGLLRTAADALENHHEVRMPVDEVDDDEE